MNGVRERLLIAAVIYSLGSLLFCGALAIAYHDPRQLWFLPVIPVGGVAIQALQEWIESRWDR